MEKYLFIDFLSTKKKEKSGLEQYHLKILLLIIIPEYVDNNTRACRYHWPPNCKSFISYRGKERLTESPSVFDGIPAGCLSLPPPKPRNAVLASGSSRNVIPDELEQFREVDSLVYGDVIEKVIINYDLILFFRTRSRNKYTIIGN